MNRKYGWTIFLTVGLCFVFAFCLSNTKETDSLSFRVFSPSGAAEDILCWNQDEERCYVFLPSYADLSRTEVHFEVPKNYQVGGIPLSEGMTCGGFSLDTDYELTADGITPKTLQFVQSANVATMYIDTLSGNMKRIHADKTYKEKAAIHVYSPDGQVDYWEDGADQIRGRGNSTWRYEKKPYNLYLQQPSQLLGMNSGKKWALLANAQDETNLRNKIVLDFAEKIKSYTFFAPDCAFVDLYLNGEYAGIYLLCEKIEAAENRLNLGNSDFLFLQEVSRFDTMKNPIHIGPIAVDVLWPGTITENEKKDLQLYFEHFQEAILADDDSDAWKEYIDLDSWSRKFLIEEIFSNFDAGKYSQYFYLNAADHKIYAGPCWDYDLTAGKMAGTDWYTPNCLLTLRDWNGQRSWYSALWRKEAFRDYVKSVYSTVFLPEIALFMDESVPALEESIFQAAAMNSRRWNSAVDFQKLNQYLSEHISFLNTIWIENAEYCTITLLTSEIYNLFVPINSNGKDIPFPVQFRSSENDVWYRKDNDEPFDHESIITEDLTLYKKESNRLTIKEILTILTLIVFLPIVPILFIIDHRRNRQGRRGGHA